MKAARGNWTPRNVQDILSNPVHAFGILYEPQEELCEWIRALNVSVPDSFWGSPLEDQAAGYASFLEWLAREGFLTKVRDDLPPLIDKARWLAMQKKLRSESIDDNTLLKVQVAMAFVKGWV